MHQQDEQSQVAYKESNKKQVNIRMEQAVIMFPPPQNTFKLSNNPHRYSEQAALNLQKMRNIAQLLMENKITVIFHIFQLKILNRLDDAFNQINRTVEPHLQIYTLKEKMKLNIDNFVWTLTNICKNQNSKSSSLFILNLKLMFGKWRNENSKRQILRINSKIQRQSDEIDVFDKNTSKQAAKSLQKTNKLLKKQKEQKQKHFANFKQQMDQLLSHHQNYLNKKK